MYLYQNLDSYYQKYHKNYPYNLYLKFKYKLGNSKLSLPKDNDSKANHSKDDALTLNNSEENLENLFTPDLLYKIVKVQNKNTSVEGMLVKAGTGFVILVSKNLSLSIVNLKRVKQIIRLA